MYFLLAGDKRALHRYARNRRGSVALYCASVCALCAARWCGGLRSTRSGQKKSTGLEKRRRLKDSGRSPDTYIYIYIYIYISRVTESQANTSVWGSLKLAPTTTSHGTSTQTCWCREKLLYSIFYFSIRIFVLETLFEYIRIFE